MRSTILATSLMVVALASASAAPACFAADATPSVPADAASEADFQQWLATFRSDASAQGIDQSTLDLAFRGVTPDPSVHQLDMAQPEFTTPIWEYLAKRVSAENVQQGQQLLRSEPVLPEVERAYGVDAGIVAAIWCVESGYGKDIGSRDVIRSLATLAYSGRRMRYGATQLMAALHILQDKDAARTQLVGSWAGAMGQTQFIPSTYLDYAVDFDHDHLRNVWTSRADALASTASYLQRSGWNARMPWGQEVQLPASFDYAQVDLSIKKSVAEWRQLGVTGATRAIPDALAQEQASILLPAGYRGPAFLVLDNFRSILRYNNSTAYALAIGLLADGYAGAGGVAHAWPTDDPPLSSVAQITELQQRLTAKGYSPGTADGVLGPMTRAAIRAYQQDLHLPADGYASISLLQRLRQ
ncbi:Hrp-associated lytic transglycosylase [Xanthomonas translucens pv. poae]|uniref:Hrp-associated lytic transglycosylase n=1 Tax=Xanthomonas graminis pv. poae TaxID=227946 RepID=A0A0K3A030_9XANT|nr:lytic murein transglycosylase [Xanthomonas translucens]UKE60329.1 lytic murein transglycosylase [Xanthomonas translucens pv. poae]CTP91288.1 Hrp-associated lytic transglycosylase [Xanthomonas translucens pv. poae]